MLSIFMYKARPSALRSSSSAWHQAWQTYFCHINLFIQINVSIFHHMSSEIQWGSSWGTGTNDSSWETDSGHRHVFLHFHMNIQIFAWSGGIEKCWACQEHGGETQVQVPSGQVSSLKSMNFCILMNFCIALIPGYCAPRPIEGHRQHDPGGLCGPNHQSLALRLECIGILEPQIFIPIKKGFFKTTWSNQVLNGLRKKRVLLNNLEPPSPQSHFFVPLPSELKVFFLRLAGPKTRSSNCRFSMLCPFCNEVRYSKDWRPSQYKLREPIQGHFQGCKQCDVLIEPEQVWMAEKIEWRFWYLEQDDAQRSMNALMRLAHGLSLQEKDRLHHSYHSNPFFPGVGESIASRLSFILFSPFMTEAGISNPKTAANLLETALEMAFQHNGQHQLLRDIRDFLVCVHFLELYRTQPFNGPFFSRFLRGRQFQ